MVCWEAEKRGLEQTSTSLPESKESYLEFEITTELQGKLVQW